MATTEAIFNLKVNTGNSVEDVEKLDKAIKDTQTTAGTGKGVEDFAKKLDALDKQLAEGNLTMRQRSKLVKEYQQIALQAGETSPVGERAVRSAAALSDEIADMNQRVRMLASDTVKLDTALEGISVGASIFQGVQSAMALTGVENEELIKSMQKLQAVQGVTNAIQQVTNALNKDAILGIQLRLALEKAKNFVMTGSIAGTTALAGAEAGLTTATAGTATAMKALRLALIATGIGAIIVAVGLLVTNFDKVTGAVMKAYDWFDKLGKNIKIATAIIFPFIGLIYGAIKALEYFNIIESKQDKQRAENHKQHMKRVDAQIKKQEESRKLREKIFNQEQAQYSREIALLDSLGKETIHLQQLKIQSSINYQKEKQRELETELRAVEFLRKSSDFYAKFYGDDRMQILKQSLDETKEAILNSENELQILTNNFNKKKADEYKAEREKRLSHLKDLDDILKESLEREEKRRIDFANFLKTQNDEILDESERRYLEQLKREEEAEQRSIELQKAYRRIVQSELENELDDLRLNYAEKENIINLAWANRMISDEERNRQLLQLQEQQAKDEVELEKRKQQELREQQEKAFAERVAGIERIIGYTQQLANATASINQFMNASDNERLKQAKGNEVEEEKIKRRIFERDKKLRKVQVAIDTASNVITSIKNNGGIPYGLPAGAIALTAGAFQLAAISKATFDGGAGLQTASPQQLSAPVQSQQTNTAELPETEKPQAQQTVKVVVLENDITNIQQRVKVAENLSSF
jgi:hypothetical protein